MTSYPQAQASNRGTSSRARVSIVRQTFKTHHPQSGHLFSFFGNCQLFSSPDVKMSGSGYDAVVDVDDEVRWTLTKLTHRYHQSLKHRLANKVVPMRTHRATSATPTSKKTSNSTAPTSPNPRAAAARSPAPPAFCPLRQPPRPPLERAARARPSATSGACPFTRSSSTSTPRPCCRAAGRRSSRAQTSSTCSRATPTCTGRFGSPRRWCSSCSWAARSASIFRRRASRSLRMTLGY